MKKYFLVIAVFAMSLLLVACGGSQKEKLVVYNWGEYIDPEVITDFEKETGISVVYETFEQNEDMYTKIKEGGSSYDVLVPSDYMIERLLREDLLEPLDFSNIPNLKNLDEDFLHPDYDPEGKYSVAYIWGTVGILYNKEMVDDTVDSWNILWDEKYRGQIIMMNSTRDSIGVALKKNGFSMNTRDKGELEIAKGDLLKQKPLVLAYLVDEMKGQMINGEAALAVAYSGDAMVAIEENENLAYVIPKEGSNIWVDAMVIPKGAKNKANAEKFINYMLDPEVAKKNGEFIGFSLPNKEGVKLLDEETRNNEVIYPDLDKLPPLEYFKDPQDIVTVYDEIWSDIKAQ